MKTLQIEKILIRKLQSTYVGVVAKDELPRTPLRPLAIVVNTDPASKPRTHWMCIYLFSDGTGEFFDTFGRYPDSIVVDYLNKQAQCGWRYNQRRVQSIISTLCGGYCLLYLECRNKNRTQPMSQIVDRLFPYTDPWVNDMRVRRLIQSHYGVVIPIMDDEFILKSLMRRMKIKYRER